MVNQWGQLVSLTALIIIFIVSTGCISNPDALEDHPGQGSGESPEFSDVWTVALSKSGIDDRTAGLGNLMVWLDGNASIDTLFMDFSGKEGGVVKSFQMGGSPDGRINVHCLEERPQKPFSARLHPMVVLSAMEELPIRTIDPSGDGITIWTGPMCCDISYSCEYTPIIEIRKDSLIPIEKIAFDLSSGESIYPVHVCRHTTDPGAVAWSTDEFVEENKSGGHCWTFFTAEDVAKAQMVEYSVGTAILDISRLS